MIKYYNEDHIGDVILSGGTEQRNLPEGYTQVEYLQSDGSCYIDLLRIPNNNDIIEQKFQIVSISTGTHAWYGSMPSNNQTTPRIGIGLYSNNKFFCGINHTTDLGVANTNVHTLRFQATGQREITYTFDGTTAVGVTTSDTDTPVIQLSSYLFARHGDDGVQVYDGNGTKIFYHKEYLADNTLVMNLIPCRRNLDNVLGMYDTVTGNFLTNQGTGTLTAGSEIVPTPDAPMNIVCNNGVLKLSPNLFNKDLVPDENKYIAKGNGSVTTPKVGNFRHSDYIEIKENTEYYVGIINSTASAAGLAFYDDTKTYISGISLTELGNDNNIITSPTNTKYIRFSFSIDEGYNINWQNTVYFIEGNQPLTKFIPYNVIYADGTTETVWAHGKNLFDVSDYNNLSDWQGINYRYVEIPLPNGTYTVSWDKTKGRSHMYWLIQVTESVIGTSKSGTGGSWLWHATLASLQKEKFTFTVTKGKAWFSCSFGSYFDDFLAALETVQIERGSTATTYEPYFDGGTATAEMLLKVGDYVDTQKVIGGKVTRNVGVMVLKGTENWVIVNDGLNNYIKSDACNAYYNTTKIMKQQISNCVLLCNIAPVSHGPIWNTVGYANRCTVNINQLHLNIANDVLGITDYTQETTSTALAKFKQYLADQYANGTPVIIVYPLATPTTEEVDSQFLDGEYVEQISGSISNLPIEISHIHDLKKRYVTDSNGNATEITKIYKGTTLLWER